MISSVVLKTENNKSFCPRSGKNGKGPSALVLPGGKVVKRIEGARIHRVTWKIVRGLFFFHEGKVLSEATPNHIEYVAPDARPPPPFFALNEEPNLGQYPGVFDFRYKQFSEANNLWYWAMLFWDAFLVLMAFHDFDCKCHQCRELSIRLFQYLLVRIVPWSIL